MKTYTAILLIIFIGFLVYSNCFSNSFVWDDELLILKNPNITKFANIKDIFSKDLFYGESNYYRPIQSLSLLLDYKLWCFNPFGYHLTNVLLHIINSILIYLLYCRIFYNADSCRNTDSHRHKTGSQRRVLALLLSLLWVVHPIHTEAITYISGRAEPLATMFILLALIIHTAGFQDRGLIFSLKQKIKVCILYLVSCVFYICALLSKEVALIFPFLLLILFLFLKKDKDKPLTCNLQLVMCSFITAVYIGLRLGPLKFAAIDLSTIPPLKSRIISFFASIYEYVKLLFLPLNLHMERIIELKGFSDIEFIAGVIILLLIIGIIYNCYKKDRIISFGLSWFLLSLIPVSGVFPLDVQIAEHWLYLPSIGFFIAIGYGVSVLWTKLCHFCENGNNNFFQINNDKTKSKFKLAPVVWSMLFAGLICFYGFLTLRRNLDWKDNLSFFTNTVKFPTRTAKAHYMLGKIAYENFSLTDKAINEYNKALKIDPNYYKAHYNIGLIYDEKGYFEQALKAYKATLKIKPDFVRAHLNIGNIYAHQGAYKKAIIKYKEAIAFNKNDPKAYYNLGNIYFAIKDYDKATIEYNKALRIKNDFLDARNNIAVVYLLKRQYDMSIEEYKKIIKTDPWNIQAYNNISIAYSAKKDYVNALRYLKIAQSINPSYKKAASNLQELLRH